MFNYKYESIKKNKNSNSNKRDKRVSINLTYNDYIKLDEFCNELNITKSELVRTLLKEANILYEE